MHVLPDTQTDNEGTRASAAAPPFCPPPACGGAIALPLADKALGSGAALPVPTSPGPRHKRGRGVTLQQHSPTEPEPRRLGAAGVEGGAAGSARGLAPAGGGGGGRAGGSSSSGSLEGKTAINKWRKNYELDGREMAEGKARSSDQLL